MPSLTVAVATTDHFDEDVDDQGRQTVLEAHGYRVIRSLGHGSYATVKLAHSERHHTNVAVKIVSKKRAPKDYIDKFLPREISIVKMIRHQNVVIFLQVTTTTTAAAPQNIDVSTTLLWLLCPRP